MKRLLAVCCLGWALVPETALASEKGWDGGYAVAAERRSGFAGALSFGVGVGSISGYPNAVSKIDDPAYRSATGAAPGSSFSLWLGGAIRDWFTVGLGISSLGAAAGDIKGGGTAYILHVETFPLWNQGGKWRDLALFANVGAGSLVIEGGPEKADGGLMSVLGAGISYELLRFGHFTLGPVLEGGYRFSQSATAYGVFAGVRTTIYGGP
jgi:hypothetical protein